MSELVIDSAYGELRVQGWLKDKMQLAAELAEQLVADRARCGEFIDFDGGRVYLKAGPLSTRSGLRHALRRLLARRRAPRIQEYFNLSWLVERHFRTVLPLAAGVFLRQGIPRYQFLLTEEVPGSEDMRSFLQRDRSALRAELLSELARELARMHALGFLHHDLFPRNLLVSPALHGRRIVFLDCWAGGPPTQLRPLAYDLACFLCEGSVMTSPEEQARFFKEYVEQRARQGRAVDAARLHARVSLLRRALIGRLERDPQRLRGLDLPSRSWDLDLG